MRWQRKMKIFNANAENSHKNMAIIKMDTLYHFCPNVYTANEIERERGALLSLK